MAEKYPRIPDTTWWQLRTQFTKAYPSIINVSYLKTLLKIESSAANIILSGLKRLGLVGEDDKPTSRANDWRNDTKYQDTCQVMRDEVYPAALREVYSSPLDKNSINGIKEWFAHENKVGKEMARQQSVVYILLTNAQIKPPEELTNKIKDKSTKKPIKSLQSSSNTLVTNDSAIQLNTTPLSEPLQNPNIETKKNPPHPSLHIDLQIHISPDATADQIDAIFASMAKHLYK